MVRTPQADALGAALRAVAPGVHVTAQDDGTLLVENVDAAFVGRAALHAGAELHELRPATSDLEEVFLSLTSGDAS